MQNTYPEKDMWEYHAPTPESVVLMKELTDKTKELYEVIKRIPDSRERALAITKLREARMWWNAAIVFTQK